MFQQNRFRATFTYAENGFRGFANMRRICMSIIRNSTEFTFLPIFRSLVRLHVREDGVRPACLRDDHTCISNAFRSRVPGTMRKTTSFRMDANSRQRARTTITYSSNRLRRLHSLAAESAADTLLSFVSR